MERTRQDFVRYARGFGWTAVGLALVVIAIVFTQGRPIEKDLFHDGTVRRA